MIQIDLPMPESCYDCPLNYDFCWCEGMTKEAWEVHRDAWNDQVCEGEHRPEYCPLKEKKKLIDVDKLREKLGFAEDCEKCKQEARHCQYDSRFSLMDFCERLDMAVEELMQEGR